MSEAPSIQVLINVLSDPERELAADACDLWIHWTEEIGRKKSEDLDLDSKNLITRLRVLAAKLRAK